MKTIIPFVCLTLISSSLAHVEYDEKNPFEQYTDREEVH